MQGEHSSQSSFFGIIYEELIPRDHLLRKLAAAVDFSFVSELVGDCYCPDNGRPSWNPLVLFKVVFLPFGMLRVVSFAEPQFLYDLSDREVEDQINLHLACKSPTRNRFGDGAWFAGLQPEETAPDHSTISRFRPSTWLRAVSLSNGSRLGPEKFQEIFNEVIQRAREAGLLSDRLRIIDATHLQAKADLFRLPQPPPDTPAAEAPGLPRPRRAFRAQKQAQKLLWLPFDVLRVVSLPNHKAHIAIAADSELITAVAVTPGNVADSEEFIALVDPHAREVTADKGYDTNANHQKLKGWGQRSSIIIKKNRTAPQVIGQANPNSQRERPNIERKFAEQKKYHGLGVARYWGLVKVTVQVLLICIAVRQAHRPEQSRRVVNCTRLVKLLNRATKLPRGGLCPAGGSGG